MEDIRSEGERGGSVKYDDGADGEILSWTFLALELVLSFFMAR
jgi:hypothetical protein